MPRKSVPCVRGNKVIYRTPGRSKTLEGTTGVTIIEIHVPNMAKKVAKKYLHIHRDYVDKDKGYLSSTPIDE